MLLGTSYRFCHQKLFQEILEKFKNLSSLSIKDMEQIVYAIGLFGYKSASGIEKELARGIHDEVLTRVEENRAFVHETTATLNFLTIAGVDVSHDWIDSRLSNDKANSSTCKSNYRRERDTKNQKMEFGMENGKWNG